LGPRAIRVWVRRIAAQPTAPLEARGVADKAPFSPTPKAGWLSRERRRFRSRAHAANAEWLPTAGARNPARPTTNRPSWRRARQCDAQSECSPSPRRRNPTRARSNRVSCAAPLAETRHTLHPAEGAIERSGNRDREVRWGARRRSACASSTPWRQDIVGKAQFRASIFSRDPPWRTRDHFGVRTARTRF